MTLVWRKERGPLVRYGSWQGTSSAWRSACGRYRIVRRDRYIWIAVSSNEDDMELPRVLASGGTLRECKAAMQRAHETRGTRRNDLGVPAMSIVGLRCKGCGCHAEIPGGYADALPEERYGWCFECIRERDREYREHVAKARARARADAWHGGNR